MSMRLGLITPTRGKERAAFVQQARVLVAKQQYPPAGWYIVDHTPTATGVDMVERIRIGLDRARREGMTHVAFWEDDDYYREDYLANMIPHLAAGNVLLGSSFMPTYHLGIRRWGLEYHGANKGVSLHRTMGTLDFITKAMDAVAADEQRAMWWVDRHLWDRAREANLQCMIVDTELFDCVTIKHGVGLCGTRSHNGQQPQVFVYPDPNMHWLKRFTGDDFPFYAQVSNKLSAQYSRQNKQ